MPSFRESRIWRSAFEPNEDHHHQSWRARLMNSFEAFREKAKMLAGEIPRDLADFTVHDITHLDALWEMADLIAGPEIVLNPVEAYVLGGAFLTHDLALSATAYPNGAADVKALPLYRQGLRALFPAKEERDLDSAEARKLLAWTIRENHAPQAAKLATQVWCDKEHTSETLIDDPLLRRSLGHRIGKIAESHWLPIAAVRRDLDRTIGPPPGFPSEWTIDQFKLACLLRAADAAHIDARRAPSFLFTLRHLSGISADHWRFQNRLLTPILEHDRLCYAAGEEFGVDEADSWWLCFDAVNMINAELSSIDSQLSTRGGPRFAARGVTGAGDPEALARWIPVCGWCAVDARPGITDVTALIKKLGGSELYGDEPYVPLRELIQNAMDAIQAARIERGDEFSGRILCSVDERDGVIALTVRDNGIGMSQVAILGALLKFGSTFWHSEELRKEFPRLAERRFSTIGKYGIGFFAVFMWADQVKLVTRRFDRAADETLVLEFRQGLNLRPILRPASEGEQLRSDGGTVVTLILRDRLALRGKGGRERSLKEIIAELVPFPDVDIILDDCGNSTNYPSVDWRDIAPDKLASRTLPEHVEPKIRSEVRHVSRYVRPIVDEGGEVKGRATLLGDFKETGRYPACVVGRGGLRLSSVDQCVGVFEGEPTTASRGSAKISASAAAIRLWASEQASLEQARSGGPIAELRVADLVYALDGFLGELVVALTRDGYLNTDGVRNWARARDFVVIVPGLYGGAGRGDSLEFESYVMGTEFGLSALRAELLDEVRQERSSRGHRVYSGEAAEHTLHRCLEGVIAEAWGMSEAELAGLKVRTSPNEPCRVRIGVRRYSRIQDWEHLPSVYRRSKSVTLSEDCIRFGRSEDDEDE
jgi:hypothetical protein